MKGRPRAEELIDQDEAPETQLNDAHAALSSVDSEMDSASDVSDNESASDASEASSSDNDDDEPSNPLKTTSFGSLARAQASLDRKRKREAEASANTPQAGKLDALRSRLADIKRARTDSIPSKARPSATNDHEEDSESDSSSDTDGGRRPSRSSKHAPAAQSSRYQVSRKREVIPIARSTVRDPRFDGGPRRAGDDSWAGRAYSFLDTYEDTEMAELKAAIRKTKDEGDKMKLRRRLGAMENRRKAKVEKERRQKVLRDHRKGEREAVAQGKKPFYLKKSEQKRLELVERFEGMKGKEREKVIERRRKRESQKEKRNMPAARRIAG